jgi:hypothetical protein
MKYFKTLAVLLCSSTFFFYGCNDKNKASKKDTTKQVIVPNTPSPPAIPSAKSATKEPAQNVNGVWHYTCRIGCAGGAGSAVKCDICKIILTHNTTYHASTNSTPSAAPFVIPPKESSQNAVGVWHYTCSNGCTGGAGSAGSCDTCSGTLSHNTAYH